MGSTAMLMCLYTMDGTKKRTLLFPLWSMVKKRTGVNDSGRLIKNIITINEELDMGKKIQSNITGIIIFLNITKISTDI